MKLLRRAATAVVVVTLFIVVARKAERIPTSRWGRTC